MERLLANGIKPPPLADFWRAARRVLKPGGVVVLTGCQPFTSHLVLSNLRWFRYGLVWEKANATGFLDANRRPLRAHEDILVFCAKRAPYYPQMVAGKAYVAKRKPRADGCETIRDKNAFAVAIETANPGTRYPRSVIRFGNEKGLHPTQKPVTLMAYLVRTYTNPGALVLDPFAGSGSTAVACLIEGRSCLCVERDRAYVTLARRRIAALKKKREPFSAGEKPAR